MATRTVTELRRVIRHAISILFLLAMASIFPQASSAQTIELIGLQTSNELSGAHLATAGRLRVITNELSDSELAEVSAGDLSFTEMIELGEFDAFISQNEAGFFTMDIAPHAFNGAQGFFTTVQAVNSAVDLNLIVNIFLDRSVL